MCHSVEPGPGRTQPAPRNPGNSSASVVPARIHAIISRAWLGSARRVIATVTGTASLLLIPPSNTAGRRRAVTEINTGPASQSRQMPWSACCHSHGRESVWCYFMDYCDLPS
ncbi:hypothetical protein CS0771_52180 [Catellatospora sp. IY07-71]|nr:hypothetical protein CS0771_52180 [Catellatospora sp. IY07-71]